MPHRPYATETEHLERTLVHLDAAQRIGQMGSWQTDLESGVQIYWSEEARHIAGWDPEEAEPTVEEFVGMLHPDDRHRFLEARQDALAGRSPYAISCRFIRRDGGLRHLHIEAEVERDANGRPSKLIGIVRDVTDVMRLFEQLSVAEASRRDLLHRLIRSTEDERARLAHDLHDGPIQELSAAALRLEHLATTQPGESLNAITEQIQSVINALRTTLFDLHPTPFGTDINSKLELLAANTVPRTESTVVTDLDHPLDESTSVAVIRIAQEALQNVRAHAQASRVDLSLRSLTSELVLEIVDNGRGFDPLQTNEPGHLGLLAMRERAEAAGGTLTIESRPGQTAVRAQLPDER